jgi:hypothetical protein
MGMDPTSRLPDFSRFPRLGGTSAGAYYLAEPGVLIAEPKPGYRQTLEGARASLEEQERIARQLGEPLVVLVLLEPVRDQDRKARRVWAEEANPSYMRGLSLVGATPLARAIGSFFLGLARPKIPVAMHERFEEGIAWAHTLMEQARAERR